MDIKAVRSQFPVLAQSVSGQPLAYLDSGATTQKPQVVIDAIREFYEQDNANVHRGIHALSERASEQFDSARERIARFLGASDSAELIFTRGTTEAINLVASSFVRPRLKAGDAVVTTIMEHHSNFVPWQQLCLKAGAELRVVPIDAAGQLRLDVLRSMLDASVTLLAVTHVSNVLGTVNPIQKIAGIARDKGIPILVDGAQSVAHLPVNVTELGIDFFAFSGHKLYGPTGIGGLWARREHLEAMPPYQFGGDMIASVSVEASTWNDLPYKFEAGTPDIAGAIGLGMAVDFLSKIGRDEVAAHERALLSYLYDHVAAIDGLSILGPRSPQHRSGLIAFTVDGIHPHDLASIADQHGVAIRAGLHCAEPLHRSLGLTASARASLGVYSNERDLDQLLEAIKEAQTVFGAGV